LRLRRLHFHGGSRKLLSVGRGALRLGFEHVPGARLGPGVDGMERLAGEDLRPGAIAYPLVEPGEQGDGLAEVRLLGHERHHFTKQFLIRSHAEGRVEQGLQVSELRASAELVPHEHELPEGRIVVALVD